MSEMFAVVVILSKPLEHCVVPREYIYRFKEVEAGMLTWGVNRTHNHLLFWSNKLLDNDVAPDAIANPPDFSLARLDAFPPPHNLNSACYLARVKRFFGK